MTIKKMMGRPRVENPHNIRRGIRFDKQLDERLRNYCEAHQASLGSTVRTAVEFFLDAHDGK